jgi:RNA polymerase sigma-70 factor, ECF subfamily
MAQIPQAQRVCLLLTAIGRSSAAEIAHMFELSEAAVRQRLVKARKQFHKIHALECGNSEHQPHDSSSQLKDGI